MTLGKDMSNGLDRILTSCRDSDIASPGDFTYKFDYKGLPQIFIKRGSSVHIYPCRYLSEHDKL
jgi:hypothetical protein